MNCTISFPLAFSASVRMRPIRSCFSQPLVGNR